MEMSVVHITLQLLLPPGKECAVSFGYEATDVVKYEQPCKIHSGRSVEHCDHGFESHSRYGCLCLYCVCVR
jgi:hypothetical protein